jgi:hypothetical protein
MQEEQCGHASLYEQTSCKKKEPSQVTWVVLSFLCLIKKPNKLSIASAVLLILDFASLLSYRK